MAKIWVSIAFIFFAVCANLPAQTAPQLAQNTFPSVVMIVTSDANGQPLALGSGFSVGDAVIATNMHVIEGASAARIKVIGRRATYTVVGVIGTDPTADLALLKVNGLNAPPLQLGDSKQAAVGDQVFAVGNPEGLEGTFSEGIVSGIRTAGADTLLQITAPISPGSSGGPVIDSNGKVLGIAVATFKEGQNLNFAVPVSYLKALLAQDAGAKIRPLAGIAAQSSNHSIVTQMGSAATGGVTGGKFLWKDDPCMLDQCDFTFTVINHLDHDVRDIDGLVIFYATDGTPLDYSPMYCGGITIPAGLGLRCEGYVDGSVQTEADKSKVEFRILNFKIVP
ncbi:MAG: trypsin-like peptidase domain-containing protein [Candidatus Acidiferrales bacterium]